MSNLFIMDFSEGSIFKYEISDNLNYEDIEDFILEKGHRLKDCEFMFGENLEVVENE